MLKLNAISKSFGLKESGNLRIVLDELSLELESGQTASIQGPSGSGKSTLLNIIGALDKPDSGNVIFDGQTVTDLTESKLTQFRNREIGFVFQMHHLLPQCSVLENVLIPVLPVKNREFIKESQGRALDLIKEVGRYPLLLEKYKYLKSLDIRFLRTDHLINKCFPFLFRLWSRV